MTVFDAVRSAPTRYALVFAGLSALVMGVLLALCYAWMTVVLERHVEAAVEQQLIILRDDFQLNGRDSVISLVSRHAARSTPSPLHFLVQDNEGTVLAGDLPPLALQLGWQEVELPPDPAHHDTSARTYWGFGARLDDVTHVLVVQDTADLTLTRSLLIRSFSIALFVTVALALVGGVSIGAALLRRVDDVDRVARAIIDGDLSHRIPVVGWRDELGGLAEGLNRMLDRIEDLMNNVRHVTSSVAHDLRSPLSRNRQRLETVRRKHRSPAEYESAIDASIEGTDEIVRTFDAILRIAQIESGTPRTRFAPVDLGEIVENVGDAFAAVA
jgi:signal transduction histidine kinase